MYVTQRIIRIKLQLYARRDADVSESGTDEFGNLWRYR